MTVNGLTASILAIQLLALVAWLASLVGGRRLLGAYRILCAAFAVAAALSIASPAIRSGPIAGRVAAIGRSALDSRLAAAAPSASASVGAMPGGTGGQGGTSGLGGAASLAWTTVLPIAGPAALALSALGALLFAFRLARYARWAREARRRSVLVRREGRVEYRSWSGPACSFGALRPVVLLPEVCDRGGADAMRLHEAAHIALGHVYWNFLQSMMADLFWFNPAFRAIERRGREAREFEADEAAMLGMGRKAYAESLVAAAEARMPASSPVLASFWQAGLADRLKALLDGRRKPSALVLAALLPAALLCAGAGAAAAPVAPRYLPGPCRVIDTSKAVKVSQPFGDATNPLDGSKYDHKGIDLTVPGDTGAGIAAWDAGTVTRSGFDDVYGNYIEIAHRDGFSTLYAKLAVRGVESGDAVARGQRIGTMGSTGRSTGPHLHFELSKDGAALDPSDYL
jgi:murein DD-endopeptidase MepM/ murein hydrolase activator NlpD